MRHVARRLVCCALVLTALLPPAARARVTARHQIAPGVRLEVLRRSRPAQRIWVASVRLPRRRVRPVLATGELPGLERTSAMARRTRAVVAVNGDYARPSGRPVFTFAARGDLAQTELTYGRNLAVSPTGAAWIGHPRLGAALVPPTGAVLPLERVNAGPPGASGAALYTPEAGGLERPPRGTCTARLVGESVPRLAPDGTGVRSTHQVTAVTCRRPLRPRGGVVVAASRRSHAGLWIAGLRRGDLLRYDWSLGWPEAMETLGGNPTLVEDGRITVGRSDHPFFARHPRTAVGLTADRRLLLVVVDGRRRRFSIGMRLRELARFMRERGARWALNLDGGGSTTMVVRGRVVNRPSDGRERPVSSALVVLPDSPGAPRARRPAAPITGRRVWSRAASDPASTGGLADALSAEGAPLDPGLAGAARTFRATAPHD